MVRARVGDDVTVPVAVAAASVTDGVRVPEGGVVADWAVVDVALLAAAVSVAPVTPPGANVVAPAPPVADPCGAGAVDCPVADGEGEGRRSAAGAGLPVPAVVVAVDVLSDPTTSGVLPDAAVVTAAGVVAAGGGVAVGVDDAGAPPANRPLINPPMPQW